MKRFAIMVAVGLLGGGSVFAEPRMFTNADGKTLKVEPVSVIDDKVVLKLSNSNTATVPLKTLSADDQAYIAEWWKENKDKLKATFETDIVRCEDSSQTGGNLPREYKRETILGIIFELSAGDQDFLRQSAPENLADHHEENDR